MQTSRLTYLTTLLLLLCAVTAYGQAKPQREQQEANEAPTATPTPAQQLTNRDVIEMVEAGLSEPIIIAKIKASRHDFKTDIGALKELKELKVPETIVTLMIEVSSATPSPPPEPAHKEAAPAEVQPEQSKEVVAAEKVMAAVRRLDNATAVGVLFQNYSQLLIESKSVVDENITGVSDPEFRQYVNGAMQDYQYAMSVWNLAVANGWTFFYTKREPGRTLITKYGVPIKISIWTQLPVNTGLAHIWLSARGNFNSASNRLSQMKAAPPKPITP